MKKQRNKETVNSRKLIMLINIDEAVRNMITLCFDDSCEIVYARSIREALVYLKYLRTPQLLMVDIDFAYDGTVPLREMYLSPSTANIPVILIMKSKHHHSLQLVSQFNTISYIFKPVEADELLSKIDLVFQP